MDARPPQGPIQNGFAGLLGFLGIKGLGVTPNSIAGFVQPTLDAGLFLSAQETKYAFASFTMTGDAYGALGILPATPAVGRVWLVKCVTVRCVVGTLSALQGLGVCLKRLPNISSDLSLDDITTHCSPGPVAPAAHIRQVSACCDTPFLMLPGQAIYADVHGFAHNGLNANLTANVSYLDLPL